MVIFTSHIKTFEQKKMLPDSLIFVSNDEAFVQQTSLPERFLFDFFFCNSACCPRSGSWTRSRHPSTLFQPTSSLLFLITPPQHSLVYGHMEGKGLAASCPCLCLSPSPPPSPSPEPQRHQHCNPPPARALRGAGAGHVPGIHRGPHSKHPPRRTLQ